MFAEFPEILLVLGLDGRDSLRVTPFCRCDDAIDAILLSTEGQVHLEVKLQRLRQPVLGDGVQIDHTAQAPLWSLYVTGTQSG